jgi:hypothetical protein
MMGMWKTPFDRTEHVNYCEIASEAGIYCAIVVRDTSSLAYIFWRHLRRMR